MIDVGSVVAFLTALWTFLWYVPCLDVEARTDVTDSFTRAVCFLSDGVFRGAFVTDGSRSGV